MKRLLVLSLFLSTGCSDALEQSTSAGQVIAVVNSTVNSLSLISAGTFTATTLDMRTPAGTPVSIAGRGSILVVPLGAANAVAVVDLARRTDTVSRVIPLANNSGATGVAIQDDSVAWVTNPNLNTVTRINYRTGDTSSIGVGVYPQAVAITNRTLFVIDGNLVGFQPAGTSSVNYRTLGPFFTSGAIPLSCTNAQFAAVGADSLLYVVCSGRFGGGDGKLSIVDPATLTEVAVLNGLGEFPGAAVFHPSGRLLIASYSEGILEVNTLTRTITRGPGQGLKPGNDPVSGFAVDQRGRVYSLDPKDCIQPGLVHVLSAPPDYTELRTVTVGVCPFGAAVAVVP